MLRDVARGSASPARLPGDAAEVSALLGQAAGRPQPIDIEACRAFLTVQFPPIPPGEALCWTCLAALGSGGEKLTCGRCCMVVHCSPACQRAAWRTHKR